MNVTDDLDYLTIASVQTIVSADTFDSITSKMKDDMASHKSDL